MSSFARERGPLAVRWDQNYLLYAGVILVMMYGLGQLAHPFISHDDYDWLLQGFDQGFETPWSKAASEGRWGNFLWSKASHYLNGYSAFAIYLVLYSALCVLVARAVSPAAGILAAFLFFVSPMGAEMMLWPVTQLTGAAVALACCWVLIRAQGDGRRRLVVAVAVVACFMFYPSLGPLFLLMYAASFSGSPRDGATGAAVYVAAFVCSVLLAFTLNYFFQGHFAIKPAPWREATPLFSSGSLRGNVKRYLPYLSSVMTLWPALLGAGAAFALCFYERIRVRQCLAVLAFGCMLLGMDASLSILAGLSLPLRASLWIWLLLCIPVLFLLQERRTAVAGLVLAVPLLVTGLASWYRTFADIRTVYPAMNSLGQALSRAQASNAGKFDDTVIFGDVHANVPLRSLHSNRALRNYLFKEFRTYTKPCDVTFCEKVQTDLASRKETPDFVIIDRRLVWVLSPKIDSLY